MDREAGHAPDAGTVPRVHANASIGEAARVLSQSGAGSVVVDGPGADAAVVGLLTERDIFRALAAGEPEMYGHCVWVLVEHDFPGIDVSASPRDRMRVFCDRRVDHIALMDGFRVRAILNIWDCAGEGGVAVQA